MPSKQEIYNEAKKWAEAFNGCVMKVTSENKKSIMAQIEKDLKAEADIRVINPMLEEGAFAFDNALTSILIFGEEVF